MGWILGLTGPHAQAVLVSLQELAGFTGGDASFLKEDFELQLNKSVLWDSVSPTFRPWAPGVAC